MTARLEQGIILVDIMTALALAALFIAILGDMSYQSRSIFLRAKSEGDSLSRLADPSSLLVRDKMYGNERIEESISIAPSDTGGSSRVSLPSFTKIKASDDASIAHSAGTPLCSVDFFSHNVTGAYSASRSLSASAVRIDPVSLPIDPAVPLTDLQVRDGIAYLSTDSVDASDPDILVIDMRPQRPVLLSSINTGPGIQSIALAGDHIYGAARSASAELHIIRLDSLGTLVLESKYKIPLPFATAAPAFGSSIFFDDDKIYLGTEKWSGDELNVIDVSNPATPSFIGGFKTDTKINSIFVKNGMAYIADSDQYELHRIDVSDPSRVSSLGSFSPSGWSRQEGKVVSVFEDGIGFGRTSGGFNIPTDYEAFDFSSTSSRGFSSYNALDVPGGVYGIIEDKSHTYLATRQIDKEFQILDRRLSSSSVVSYPLPVAPQRMTCDGDRIYILAGTAPVIYQVSFN